MDPGVALLKEFSRGFVRGKAKIETEQFGFAYLEQLLSDGATLEYGELINTRLLHKYKIGSIAEIVGEKGGGRCRSVEKSKGGTFPPRLEIPQARRDFHFSHRRCADYDE